MGNESANRDSAVVDASAEQVVEGVPAAPGVAIGTVYRYDASLPDVRRDSIDEDEVDDEIRVLDDAIERARQELKTVRFLMDESLKKDGEAIIDAQAMMLRDEELRRAIRQRIRNDHASAAAAVRRVLEAHRNRLEGSGDRHFQDRAGDIIDLEKRILGFLERSKVAARVGRHSIVVAQSLTATDILRFSRRGILGCVTEDGGPTSHVSIIAKALGLPLVVGVADVLGRVSSGERVVVDGEEGTLIVEPSESTVEEYERRRTERDDLTPHAPSTPEMPAQTTDGHTLSLRANVELQEELELLEPYGAEGVGLVRTEMLFMGMEGGLLSEDAQVEMYKRVAEASGREGGTIRLLDLGGEKRLPLTIEEDNPALGWRGIRILLDRVDELLRPQLRAVYRANRHGSLRVLAPMVARVKEVEQLRDIMDEVREELVAEGVPHDPNVPLGIMVEVPSSAMMAEAFAERVDFFSIGTNDLTQYALAVDRRNERVSRGFDALHPAVLRLIRRTVEAGHAADCWVELCGESAGDLLAVPVLLGLGLDGLSTSPQSLPAVARTVRRVSFADARELAEAVLDEAGADDVRRRAQTWFERHVSSEDAETDRAGNEQSRP